VQVQGSVAVNLWCERFITAWLPQIKVSHILKVGHR